MPLDTFSSAALKPDVNDIRRVFDLHHLARCIEHRYYNPPSDMNINFGVHDLPQDKDVRARIRLRFHRSIYRVLTAGAALARLYTEPMLEASTFGKPHPWASLITTETCTCNHGCEQLTQAGLDSLLKHAAYDSEAGIEKWDPSFLPLAAWLMDDIKRTSAPVGPRQSRFSPISGFWDNFTADEAGWIQEVLWFLAAYEHMNASVENNTAYHKAKTAKGWVSGTRTANICLIGEFSPIEICMPARPEESNPCVLLKDRLWFPSNDSSASKKGLEEADLETDISHILRRVYEDDKRLNRLGGNLSVPIELIFVKFLLARFFNLEFGKWIFSDDKYHMEDYELSFVGDANLFRGRFVTDVLYTESIVRILDPGR